MREQQVADLLAFVRDTDGGAPSIIAGDLNAESTSPELAALLHGFPSSYDLLHPEAARDPRAHATLNPHFFPVDRRRIDHVLLERGRFAPLESRIILDRPSAAGRWPSDHFGLVTRARILPR
jgi:endonuclease/exonuclease/phosphatase family metal-dependent hydrolase